MRKKDELASPDSCLNHARDDEWTFVLLGRDIASPETIRHWCAVRIAYGKNGQFDPQITEALNCADAMEREYRERRYPKGQPSSIVDDRTNELVAFSSFCPICGRRLVAWARPDASAVLVIRQLSEEHSRVAPECSGSRLLVPMLAKLTGTVNSDSPDSEKSEEKAE